jgi:hypothetical protein
MLDQVDTVYFLVDGKVAASGGHRELLDGEPGYRALVARDVDALDDLDDLEALDAGEGIDGVDGVDGVDAEEALR